MATPVQIELTAIRMTHDPPISHIYYDKYYCTYNYQDAHTIADTPHECARLLNSQRCCGVEHETIVQDHHKNRSELSQQRPSTSILYRMIR